MGNYKDIASQVRLEEEKKLLSFMENAINSSVIHKLLSITDRTSPHNYISSYMKGYNLPLSEKVGAKVFNICKKIQSGLGLEEKKIEYLISSSPELNASSLFNMNYSEKNPHFVILNSGLLERLDEKELHFVIGHEIGHLVYEHTLFRRIIQFIYPEYDKMPPVLKNFFDLWRHLGEMSADRVGMMAVKEIEPAVMAMFKLSSGLGQNHLRINYADIVEMNDKLLGEMSESSFHNFETHPTNPVRVKSLNLFFESETWKGMADGRTIDNDEKLNGKTEKLVAILKKQPSCDAEHIELGFLASAGLMIMFSDEDADVQEIDYLTNVLSEYMCFPSGFIEGLMSDPESIAASMKKGANYIVEHHPVRARKLFKSLLPLLLRDRKLHDNEVEIALRIAVDELKIPFHEAVEMMLSGIRNLYVPLG